MNEELQHTQIYHIDLNKNRKNILLTSQYDYPLFTVMDSIVPYTNQTKAGLYYVETNSYFPLRGNGWYLFPMIDYCLSKDIIKSSDIKYTIQASLTVSHDYYNEFIELCYAKLGDKAKLSINSMIGCFKMKAKEQWKSQMITDHLGEAKYVQISTSANEALKKFIDLQGSIITTREIDDVKYYQVYNKYFSERDETEALIYQQIVEIESIELHKLTKIIEESKGQVLDLNTDCVSCCFKNNVSPFQMIGETVNIDGFFWSDEKLNPKYKLEQKDHRLGVERMNNYKRSEHYLPQYGKK